MAQFAPVAPIQILEALQTQQVLGRYHLLLAHHVLEHPERFRALFQNISGATIIMDNSIVELGASQNEDKVLEACKAIQDQASFPNYIIPVLSDVMGDGAATRELAHASYEWWGNAMKNLVSPLYSMMVVAQGDSWEDFTKTVDYFLLSDKFPSIGYVGVPRKLTEILGTRQLAIQYIDAVRPDIGVHLLGFSDDVTDDVICAQHPGVEGIDSAVPIRYSHSQTGATLYTPSSEIPPRPADWFELGKYDSAIYTNLQNMRKWVA